MLSGRNKMSAKPRSERSGAVRCLFRGSRGRGSIVDSDIIDNFIHTNIISLVNRAGIAVANHLAITPNHDSIDLLGCAAVISNQLSDL